MCRQHPSSEEINFRISNPARIMDDIGMRYVDGAILVDELDGPSLEHADWRFILRCSNTEPLLRLNVETAGSLQLSMRHGELSDLIRATA